MAAHPRLRGEGLKVRADIGMKRFATSENKVRSMLRRAKALTNPRAINGKLKEKGGGPRSVSLPKVSICDCKD